MTATRTRRRPAAALLAACAALRAATAAGQVRRAVAPALQAQPRASSQPPPPHPPIKTTFNFIWAGSAALRRLSPAVLLAPPCSGLRGAETLAEKEAAPPRCAPLWSRPPRCARRCMAPRQGVSLGARALARGVLRGRRGGGGAPYSRLAQPTRPWAQEPRRGSSAAIPRARIAGRPCRPMGGSMHGDGMHAAARHPRALSAGVTFGMAQAAPCDTRGDAAPARFAIWLRG